ncbi:Cysteine-rich RLK (RECEPTOR-like protein kinase) 8, putative [Theobroma cacao]|uniref:Cysteine-rich RLK (RECEPTOR-like protein kinase) 8, putative n=1 Tax=Theobroma cacao TaxID=3641 RepID=A0A061DZC0_THECC|nr:Cysteine-rich RLK (RECEPTOR-like protein kinase) 8, putative [Theobroma cacao]
MDCNSKLTKDDATELIQDAISYRKLVGSLLYLTFTRPHISFVMQCLSQFMDKPRVTHLQAAYRVLRYLKSTPSQGVLLPTKSNLQLQVYTNSDWAGCKDSRKSISGFGVFLGNSIIN